MNLLMALFLFLMQSVIAVLSTFLRKRVREKRSSGRECLSFSSF